MEHSIFVIVLFKHPKDDGDPFTETDHTGLHIADVIVDLSWF